MNPNERAQYINIDFSVPIQTSNKFQTTIVECNKMQHELTTEQ